MRLATLKFLVTENLLKSPVMKLFLVNHIAVVNQSDILGNPKQNACIAGHFKKTNDN